MRAKTKKTGLWALLKAISEQPANQEAQKSSRKDSDDLDEWIDEMELFEDLFDEH